MRDVVPGHHPNCEQRTDPFAVCSCEALEDREIATASMPSPADLIRLAKAKGLLGESAPAYQ